MWLVLLVGAVVLVSLPLGPSRILKSSLNLVVAPALRTIGYAKGQIGALKESLATRKDLLAENSMLREKVDRLSSAVNVLKEAAAENQRLNNLLDFKRQGNYDVIPAGVIGRDPSNWYESIVINKGAASGAAVDMPVVTAQGLVGKIVEVSPHSSKVLLIIDKNSRVGAMVQSSRDYGVLEGTSSGVCKLNYLSRNAVVNISDDVVSSGLGAVYPKGLMVGKIVKVGIDDFSLNKYAEVEPICDFSKLEEVLVLKIKSDLVFDFEPAEKNKTVPAKK
jgi:rod shape-determining protein MreC